MREYDIHQKRRNGLELAENKLFASTGMENKGEQIASLHGRNFLEQRRSSCLGENFCLPIAIIIHFIKKVNYLVVH